MALRQLRERIEDVLIGERLKTEEIKHQTAPNFIALAVLASDALSSVAYATEEILIILSTASLAGLALFGFENGISIPIAMAICGLIIIVTISYRQTIFSNPAGGGGYRVAKENLGEGFAQVTGVALLTDYILTVAVSMSAGVAQVISVAPALAPYRVPLTVAVILFMTVVNLRGTKESARLFAIPTYFFLATMALTIIVGFVKAATGQLGLVEGLEPLHHATEPITILLLLRAFSSGCTALTGIEAISNDTQLFKEPRPRNAANTLVAMSVILVMLFMSITILANLVHAVPSHSETVISQIARTVHGQEGFGYFLYVISMAGAFSVLFMAANTAFADFPQLAALASADGFLPRQLTYRGRRLVFSWGVVTLALSAIAIVIITGAVVTNIIPLYAIGVFLGFTISQAGMMRRFWRAGHLKPGEIGHGLETSFTYDPNWVMKFIISAVGAFVTGVVMIVFVVTKFAAGAWFIVLVIPFLVWVFFQIHRHYKETAAKLRLETMPVFAVKPIEFDPAIHKELAVYFCDTWSKLAVSVVESILKRGIPLLIVHINVDDRRANAFKRRSNELIEKQGWDPDIMQVIDEPYRDLYKSVGRVLQELNKQHPDVYLEVYMGALRVKAPYNWLHVATDRFLREAMLGIENVSLNIRHVDLDALPLPEGFKVTFEHHVEEPHDPHDKDKTPPVTQGS